MLELKRQPLPKNDDAAWLGGATSDTGRVFGERLSVVSGEKVVAEAVLQQLPDRTLSVVFLGRGAAGFAVERILKAAADSAKCEGLRYAYTFVDANLATNLDAQRNESFSGAGFQKCDRILELNGVVGDLNLPGVTGVTEVEFWQGDAAGLNSMPVRESEWNALLEDIIHQSLDLQDLPPPTPAQLQAMWQSMDANVKVSIVSTSGRPVGLAVLSYERGRSAVSEVALVEYVGVHSSVRRRGNGSRVLSAAVRSLASEVSAVTTFVASRNLPARAFFDRCGFELGVGQDLWVAVPGGFEHQF